MGVKVALIALLVASLGLVAGLATPEELVRVRYSPHEARGLPGVPFFLEGSLSGLGLSSACETAKMIPGISYLNFADKFWSNWNQSCLFDPDSGQNCNDYIASWPEVNDITELPKEDICSFCNVQRLAMMQANAYTNTYDENFASMYQYTASECQLTVSNFNATPSAFNVTVDEIKPPICVSDTYYTTKQGDTCDSIALAQGMSAATLFYINANILNCTAITADNKLCLPLACDHLYSVQPDDDCSSIAADSGILTRDLLSYNSQITWNCTNLQVKKRRENKFMPGAIEVEARASGLVFVLLLSAI